MRRLLGSSTIYLLAADRACTRLLPPPNNTHILKIQVSAHFITLLLGGVVVHLSTFMQHSAPPKRELQWKYQKRKVQTVFRQTALHSAQSRKNNWHVARKICRRSLDGCDKSVDNKIATDMKRKNSPPPPRPPLEQKRAMEVAPLHRHVRHHQGPRPSIKTTKLLIFPRSKMIPHRLPRAMSDLKY